MTKFLVIETFFDDRPQNYYFVLLPDVRGDGFYRATMSFNAFFNSARNPKANVTSVRQFTAKHRYEIEIEKKFLLRNVDLDNLKVFESIWEFFEFIGYDRKTRAYRSGEAMKVFRDGRFVLPGRRKETR